MFEGLNVSGLLEQFSKVGNISGQERHNLSTKPHVSVEFYYLTTCPHCLALIQQAMAPIVEARLPGNLVQLTVLPVLKGMASPQECMVTGACHLAFLPLCVLQKTMPQPSSADSEDLRRAVRFMACDMNLKTMRPEEHPKLAQECVLKAGFEWETIHACATSSKVFDIMYSEAYARPVVSAMRRLKAKNFRRPPSMPWIFLDGELMTCSIKGCVSAQMSRSRHAQSHPGSLLSLICDKLAPPQPEACRELLRSKATDKADALVPRLGGKAARSQARNCVNCAEVNIIQWHEKHGSSFTKVGLLAFLVLLAITATGAVVGFVYHHCHQDAAGDHIHHCASGPSGILAWHTTQQGFMCVDSTDMDTVGLME